MSPRPRRTGRALGLTALALALPFLPSTPTATADVPTAAAAAAAVVVAPVDLWAPRRVEAYSYEGRAYTDLGLRLRAHGEPLELWSSRASYAAPIRTVWRSSAGDRALPAGAMPTFATLRRFLRLQITPVKGGPTKTVLRGSCLAGTSERVVPSAPATSDYPRSCYYNPYALGSVQGIQQGWATSVLGEQSLRLKPGRYRVVASITPAYARVFGLGAAQASRTLRLVVKGQEYDEDSGRRGGPDHARPADREPTTPRAGRVPATTPDLRALPAWGIKLAPSRAFLQFSATVWNAGTSPLVVDGFRREGEDEMDAYQYFFDADGEQTGYQRVGHMHWDAKPTHQHWHFKDFATYTLLKADKTAVVRSRKEAFCLANTDAVDTSVPGAEWNPDGTDLATACGDHGSLSIREVLASGWGDTYAQFRAGQSFSLEGLPNGTYYIEVRANPRGRLVETSQTNNVALRRIVLGGRPGARTVRVPKVGTVTEPPTDWF